MSLSGILGGFETRQKQIFHIFGTREKIRNFFFQEKSGFFGKNRYFIGKYRYFIGKYRYLSENIGIYRKNRRFFADFLPSDFSTAKSFPGPPKSDFSPKNRPISAIFLFLGMTTQLRSQLLTTRWLSTHPCQE